MERQQIVGNINAQEATGTALGVARAVTVTGHVALRGVDLGGEVGEDSATPTLTTILETSERVVLVVTGLETSRDGHAGRVHGLRPGQGAADAGGISVTAQRRVVVDALGTDSREGWVLPHREGVVTTTLLVLVTLAREAAVALVLRRTIDGGAAVADTVVLEAGIAEAVTLALGDTVLNSHVGRWLRGSVDKPAGRGPLGTIRVAAGVDKRLEGAQARGQLDVPSLRPVNEGERRTGDGGSKRRHVAKERCNSRRLMKE